MDYLTALKLVLKYKTLERRKIRSELEKSFLSDPVERVKVKGVTMYLNPVDQEISARIASSKEWENQITAMVTGLLRPNSIVVDVGANIGWYTLISARIARQVHAFEPDPTAFSLLQKSVITNDLRNVILHPCCAMNYDGETELYLSRTGNKGNNSVVWHVSDHKIIVPCVRLDSIFPTETIDILKIDAEGAEPQILHGAISMVRENRVKHVIMEWNPKSWRDGTSLIDQFEIFGLDNRRLKELPNFTCNLHLIRHD